MDRRMCSALHRIIKRTGAVPEMLDFTVTTFAVPSMVTFSKPDYVAVVSRCGPKSFVSRDRPCAAPASQAPLHFWPAWALHSRVSHANP